MDIEMSRFHDLMHWPFTRECRSRHGGSRRHIKLYWEYRLRSELRRNTLCRIHWHRRVRMTDHHSGRTVRPCWYCGSER